MKRYLAILLLAACSTFSLPQTTALQNTASILRVRSAAYANIDCGECSPCVIMQSTLKSAAAATPVLDKKEITKKDYLAFNKELRDCAAKAAAVTCDCVQDQEYCAPTKDTFSLAVQQLDEIDKNLKMDNAGEAILGGASDRVGDYFGGSGGH